MSSPHDYGPVIYPHVSVTMKSVDKFQLTFHGDFHLNSGIMITRDAAKELLEKIRFLEGTKIREDGEGL